MTIRRRQVLDYVLRCEAKGERIVLGKLIRAVGLNQRSDAKRIMSDLKKMGLLKNT